MRTRRGRRLFGIALVGLGALLVAAVGGYWAYGWMGTQRLDSLNSARVGLTTTRPAAGGQTLDGVRDGTTEVPLSESAADGQSVRPAPGSMRLYPGERLTFVAWADPWSAEPPLKEDLELAEGYLPFGKFAVAPPGSLSHATRMAIPSIGLDAAVQDLEILDLGDSREYETPKFVVGHIPQTTNPGEAGTAWYFGHLQSPIRNEGSVFSDLPLIPGLLKERERVYVVLDSPSGSFLYDVYETKVVYQDELRLFDEQEATIVLVTCVPTLKYDYRLLVMARLVGFRPVSG